MKNSETVLGFMVRISNQFMFAIKGKCISKKILRSPEETYKNDRKANDQKSMIKKFLWSDE